MDTQTLRVNDILLGNNMDASRENHVNAGFRVTGLVRNDGGEVVQIQVRRIHATYLTGNIESFTIRSHEFANFYIFQAGQLPLL